MEELSNNAGAGALLLPPLLPPLLPLPLLLQLLLLQLLLLLMLLPYSSAEPYASRVSLIGRAPVGNSCRQLPHLDMITPAAQLLTPLDPSPPLPLPGHHREQ